MTRNDVLVWLSVVGLFAAYCAALWVFFPLWWLSPEPQAADLVRPERPAAGRSGQPM